MCFTWLKKHDFKCFCIEQILTGYHEFMEVIAVEKNQEIFPTWNKNKTE